MAARAVTDSVFMLLDRNEHARLLELLDERLAAFVAIHARVFPGALEHLARIADDLDLLEVVTLPHLEVVRIVRRRDLDRARAERLVDIFVGKERDAAADDRQDERLADEILVALIVGMHRDARIAEHRLRARRRDLDVAARLALDRVAQMPEMAFLRLVLDLDVRDGRIAGRTPVRDARALIDEALLVEAHEHLTHGAAAALIHREALAVPIERGAEGAQLEHDAATELLLPVPDALEELLAAELIAVRSLLAELPLDLRLRRDTRVVAARDPHRVVALHAMVADEDILQRIVERVAHVQLARDIRRRDNHAVRLLALIHLRVEELVLLPELIPFLLERLRIVDLRDVRLFRLCHIGYSSKPSRARPQNLVTHEKSASVPKDESACFRGTT